VAVYLGDSVTRNCYDRHGRNRLYGSLDFGFGVSQPVELRKTPHHACNRVICCTVEHSGSAERSAQNSDLCLQINKTMRLANNYYRPERGS
jgi:hypothetical protein